MVYSHALSTGLLLMVCALPIVAHAQASGIFRGTVTDEGGAGLSGAKVTIGPEGGVILRATETATSGRWMLYDLPGAGPYELRATLEGYQPAQRVEAELNKGQVRTVDFVLLPTVNP